MKNRQKTFDDLKEDRGRLLGGEDTNTHRTRHNDARIKTQNDKERRAEELSDLRSFKSGVDERLKSVQDTLGPARDELTAAKADLDTLLAKGADDAARLRTHLRTMMRT